VALLELLLLLKHLLLSLKHDVLLKLHCVHLKHSKERVLTVLILSHHHFFFVLDLMQFAPLLRPLLGQCLLKQSFLLVILFRLAAPLLFERLLEHRQKLIG